MKAEGFPGLMKNINLHIQEVHKLQDKFKEIHIIHIIVKMLKNKNKEKNLENRQRKITRHAQMKHED